MKRALLVPMALSAVLLLGTAPSSPAPAASGVHLQLDRSHPAADTTLVSPAEIRLWFSQVPQASATTVRLLRGDEPVAALGDLRQDPDDGKIFAAPVRGTLPAGQYLVSWRTMAADGHVVRGDFTFDVEAS